MDRLLLGQGTPKDIGRLPGDLLIRANFISPGGQILDPADSHLSVSVLVKSRLRPCPKGAENLIRRGDMAHGIYRSLHIL